MKDKESEEGLEYIVRKCESLIICEFRKCDIRGDYWKCYMGNYERCPVYLSYLLNKIKKEVK
jgi:hypothetical protein